MVYEAIIHGGPKPEAEHICFAITTTSATWQGYPEWGFSQTKRYLMDHNVIYEFSAEAQDLVRVTDWLPQLKE